MTTFTVYSASPVPEEPLDNPPARRTSSWGSRQPVYHNIPKRPPDAGQPERIRVGMLGLGTDPSEPSESFSTMRRLLHRELDDHRHVGFIDRIAPARDGRW